MANRETIETMWDFIFLGSRITADDDCSHEIKRHLLLGRKAMSNQNSMLKSRDITLPTKVCLVKALFFFSSSHVWMWELDYKESWALKNWRFWTVVLEKTLESPLDCKKIQPVHPKRNESGIFVERTDAEAETPILWSPYSLKKTLMLRKIEGRRKREQWRMTWLDGITDSVDMNLSKLAWLVKNPPAMQETLVWFLGREDLLEKG